MKRLIGPALLLAMASPVFAQAPTFPSRGAVIMDTLVARYPGLASGDDDQRRELTRQIVEQFVFEFPGQGYGWKAQGPNYPPSKDALARQVSGRLYVWDWQNGSTRTRQVQPGQAADDITGQFFVDVPGMDHGIPGGPMAPPPVVTPPPVPTPTPAPTPSTDLSPVLSRLGSVEAQVAALAHQQVDEAAEIAAVKAVTADTNAQVKEHRASVSKIWMRVATIAGPIITGIVTYYQTRTPAEAP